MVLAHFETIIAANLLNGVWIVHKSLEPIAYKNFKVD